MVWLSECLCAFIDGVYSSWINTAYFDRYTLLFVFVSSSSIPKSDYPQSHVLGRRSGFNFSPLDLRERGLPPLAPSSPPSLLCPPQRSPSAMGSVSWRPPPSPSVIARLRWGVLLDEKLGTREGRRQRTALSCSCAWNYPIPLCEWQTSVSLSIWFRDP